MTFICCKVFKGSVCFSEVFHEKEKTVEKLNEYVLNSAHNKLMDYLFKYAGMLVVEQKRHDM